MVVHPAETRCCGRGSGSAGIDWLLFASNHAALRLVLRLVGTVFMSCSPGRLVVSDVCFGVVVSALVHAAGLSADPVVAGRVYFFSSDSVVGVGPSPQPFREPTLVGPCSNKTTQWNHKTLPD